MESLKLKQLYSWKGTIGRGNYFAWGIILFIIKYNIDRLISIHFTGNSWKFLNYLVDFESSHIFNLSGRDQLFYLTLILTSLPFIWTGTVLTLKRLRSTGLPPIFVLVFFIPFVNLLSFAILSTLPGKFTDDSTKVSKPSYLSRLIPQSKLGNAAFAILITIAISILLTVLSIHLLNDYGWGLFIGIPFLLGFSSTILYGYHQQRTIKECIAIAFITICLCSFFLFALAIEGIICLFMAFPIGLALAIVGALIGYAVQSKGNKGNARALTVVTLLTPTIMGFENLGKPTMKTYAMTSSVLINAPENVVWKNVIEFSTLPEPGEFIFNTGIAYPIHAEIEGHGPGAIRRCVFNTGEFIEPIEIWEENHLLQFSVLQQPQPMIEMTPYKNIHAPHLNGYFASTKGQFLLLPGEEGKTLLQGTTWYYNKIWPNAYWKVWSDYVIHQIHLRVLRHIDSESVMDVQLNGNIQLKRCEEKAC